MPDELGVMIRTNAQKVSIDIINKEIKNLYETYKCITKEFNYSSKLKLIYRGQDIISKVLRDVLDEYTETIIVDNEKDYEFINDFLKFSEDVNCLVKLHKNRKTLFNYYGIEKKY